MIRKIFSKQALVYWSFLFYSFTITWAFLDLISEIATVGGMIPAAIWMLIFSYSVTSPNRILTKSFNNSNYDDSVHIFPFFVAIITSIFALFIGFTHGVNVFVACGYVIAILSSFIGANRCLESERSGKHSLPEEQEQETLEPKSIQDKEVLK
ncbi:MAG: hypothetical protein WA705_31715 [Candidatus Ozemobacteraceae bacterium]